MWLVRPWTLVLFSLLPCILAESPCLRFADSDTINTLFTDGGPGTKVLLCPSRLYRLSGTIVFTAADQELATYGYPTDTTRATIRADGASTIAVQGDCKRCARVAIRNLIIDGNRSKKGRVLDDGVVESAGLIVLGSKEGQVVADCKIKDPRGFTAIHVREGDALTCTGAVIERNEIGPVGEEYDPVVDGDDPESSPLGRPLADGISIACRDSIIRRNTFYDISDAAIVIYCSPGTVVSENKIRADKISAMAGILMVDATPFDGDYTGTIVGDNEIDASGKMIRVGIGIGAAVWSDDTDTIIRGGAVRRNTIKGQHMGFGIAAAGLDGWIVQDNTDMAEHSGVKSDRCFDEPINPEPLAMVYHGPSVKDSKFQSDFVSHDFQYVVCIDPPEPVAKQKPKPIKAAEPPKLAEKAESPAVPVAADKAKAEKGAAIVAEPPKLQFNTGSPVLDTILDLSQQRMLESLDQLRVSLGGIEAVPVGDSEKRKGNGQGQAGRRGHGGSALSTRDAYTALQTRVDALEARQHLLVEQANSLRSAIHKWDKKLAASGDWEHALLHDLQSHLMHLHPSLDLSTSHDGHAPPPHDPAHDHPSAGIDNLAALSNRARLVAASAPSGFLGLSIKMSLVVAIGVMGLYGWRRMRRRSRSKIA